MLYAEIRPSEWGTMPINWDKVQDMYKYMRRFGARYQLLMERRVLYSAIEPEFRAVLVRWDAPPQLVGSARREVLLETTDPARMEAVLSMVIATLEDEKKHAT
jgi:hypothetical protein